MGSGGLGLSCRRVKVDEWVRSVGFRILPCPSRDPFCKTLIHDLEP